MAKKNQKNYRPLSAQSGMSIIEVMVAMGIFALISASLTSLVIGSYDLLLSRGRVIEANGLAEEAIEAIRSIADIAYNELPASAATIATATERWIFDSTDESELIGNFSRSIFFSDVCRTPEHEITECPGAYNDIYSKKATVSVAWENFKKSTSTITLTSYITNWNSSDWTQADWSGGGGQTLWLNDNQFDSDDGNLDYSQSGEVKLIASTSGEYFSSGYLISSAYDMGDQSPLQAVKWSANLPENGAIRMQLRTAPDIGGTPGAWTNWFGAEGDSTYFTAATGTLISADYNGNQWMQYRAEFSSDGTASPVLNNVTLNYK